MPSIVWNPCPRSSGTGAHVPLESAPTISWNTHPTIRARFNTYRFADHKERVIDLLARVARVSVETMEIVKAMRNAPR